MLAIHSDSVSEFSFSFPCLSKIFLLIFVTYEKAYEVKTIACEAVFQLKSNFNVFKPEKIIYQEMVAAFTPIISTVKHT